MNAAFLTTPDAPVRVVSFSQLVRHGKWRLEALHSYEEHALFWFTKGQGRINIGGINRIYGPNAVVFLPAGTPHAIETKNGLFGNVVLIREHPALEMPNEAIHLRMRELTVHSEFVGLFEAMQKETAANQFGSDRACRYHAGLLGVWLERRLDIQQNELRNPATERLVKRYAALLEVRYASGVTVADMAQELGVTATHLTRCCKQAAGRSAHEMLADRLMYEARDMLLGTSLPIKRIANDLGYSSAAYFTRTFQQHIGTTPSDFRKSG